MNEYSGSKRANKNVKIKVLPFVKHKFRQSNKVLDLGCGNGYLSRYCRDKSNYIGVTNSLTEYIYMSRLDIPSKIIDLYNYKKLPFKKNSFDLIYAGHILEHLEIKDLIKIMKELYRVLNKGGMIIVETPTEHSFFYGEWSHVRPYNHDSLPKLLKDSGFLKVDWSYPNLNNYNKTFQRLSRFIWFPFRYFTHNKIMAWGYK